MRSRQSLQWNLLPGAVLVLSLTLAGGCSRGAPANGEQAAPPPVASGTAAAVSGSSTESPSGSVPSPAGDAPEDAAAPLPHQENFGITSGAGESGEAPPSPGVVQAPALPGGLAVIVENSPAARPQSGLDRADLVYEAEAEGGITRFLAIFYSRAADPVGPVRSVRTYFVDLAAPWGIPLAHAGGNASGLRRIESAGVPHLDGLKGAWESYFWRSRDRKPPHNLYTSTDLLLQGAQAYQLPIRPLGLPAETELPPGGRPVQRLAISFAPDYTVRYEWTGQGWRRYLGESPHAMADGAVPEPANLMVLAPPARWVEVTGEVDPIELALDWQGGGTALLFRDGMVWEGRWTKGGPRDSLAFWLDDQPWAPAAGATWVHVVHSLDAVAAEGHP